MNTADWSSVTAEHGVAKDHARKIIDSGLWPSPPPHRATKSRSPVSAASRSPIDPERQGRNPATVEPITIAASKKLSFTPAKALRDALNQTPTKDAAKMA